MPRLFCVCQLYMSLEKLSKDNYKRPAQTYTDNLSKDEILGLLEDYDTVSDIDTVPIGTHVRYIDLATNKFRIGGYMIKIDEEYVVLSNNKKSWSVQKTNTKFYRKVSIKELKLQYEKIIDAQMKELKEKNDTIKSLSLTIKNLKIKYASCEK